MVDVSVSMPKVYVLSPGCVVEKGVEMMMMAAAEAVMIMKMIISNRKKSFL